MVIANHQQLGFAHQQLITNKFVKL